MVAAVEAALLDLLGKHLGVPVCELLGAGQQRDTAPMLAYLFYIGDRKRADPPYLAGTGASDDWYAIRHDEALTPASIVAQAVATVAR